MLAGMQPSVQLDRGRVFVLDDDPTSSPASFFCVTPGRPLAVNY
jgi:hypothetical protein